MDLKGVDFFVCATHTEAVLLHQIWTRGPRGTEFAGLNPIVWEPHKYPDLLVFHGVTNIAFTFDLINGKVVAFYYPVSRTVDWEDIEKALEPYRTHEKHCLSRNFAWCLTNVVGWQE